MVMQFITQSNVFIKLILRFIIGIKYQANSTAAAKSLQLCPTQCDPIDGSPPDSPVPGIIQARILELPFPSPRDLPDPGIKVGLLYQRSSCCPSEPM